MSLLSVSTLSGSLLEATGASEGSAVNVDLDASLLVQIGLFVVLLLVLKPLLFDPMLKLFEEREERIEKTRARAGKVDAESATALAETEAIIAKGREAGNAERDVLRQEGVKREAELMTQVRAQTATTVEEGRTVIRSEAKSARDALHREASSLGRSIASRVLGREVSA